MFIDNVIVTVKINNIIVVLILLLIQLISHVHAIVNTLRHMNNYDVSE